MRLSLHQSVFFQNIRIKRDTLHDIQGRTNKGRNEQNKQHLQKLKNIHIMTQNLDEHVLYIPGFIRNQIFLNCVVETCSRYFKQIIFFFFSF